jgi:hypothetical protein
MNNDYSISLHILNLILYNLALNYIELKWVIVVSEQTH